MFNYIGQVENSRPSLQPRETWGKWPLDKDPDRGWCHRHTSVKFFLVAAHDTMDCDKKGFPPASV